MTLVSLTSRPASNHSEKDIFLVGAALKRFDYLVVGLKKQGLGQCTQSPVFELPKSGSCPPDPLSSTPAVT